MVTALHWSDFEIERELGSGRAGVVVLARLRRSVGRLTRGHAVAIKRYKSWVIDEPGQLERIFRALETGRKIVHQNLVNTVGIIADDLGRPALVMKYYEGESLQKTLERHRLGNEPAQRLTLTERIGLNRLEFYLGLLDSTLVASEKRSLSLASLEAAIEGRFFEQQFHFDQGKCVPGAPLFHPLGSFDDGPGSITIGDIVQEARSRLGSDELMSLRASLKDQYWGDWFPSNPTATEPLVRAGAVKTDYVTEFQMAEFHPAIRYAYRYGML